MDFKQKLMTKKEQDAFIESMNLGKQQNIYFVADLGESVQILAGLVGLGAVTCLCAYLLIYNIMYLSVAGNVRYYGLLQTVGMTEKQIKRMVKEQMLRIGTAGRRRKGKIIARLSLGQFAKDKKRTMVVLVSLAASMSVYICVMTMLDSQAARTIVSNYMDADLVIKNDTAYKEKAKDRRDILDGTLVKRIKETPGVSEVHSISFAEITVPWEPDFAEMWMKEFYDKWMSIPYEQEKEEYQSHPENFASSLLGINEQEFDYLNESLEHPVKKEEFLLGKVCILYRNDLDFADADILGKEVTCALYEEPQTTKTFTIGGMIDDGYYVALLGYPPTIITSDRVVEAFAHRPITLKTSVKYEKEYDRDTEQEIMDLLEENDNRKDFSWVSQIEDADEIEKAQGNMMQIGIGIVMILAFIGIMNYLNTSVVNVQSRMRELSVMESIGMTPKQLLGMLVREGSLYAGGAWLVTLTAGMGVTYLLYESMNYRKIAFSVPLLPLFLAVGVSFLVCTMVPVLTWTILAKKRTVVERMKGIE